MTLETYYKLIECNTMGEVEQILDTLKEGNDFKFVDEKLDEPLDDEEDDYLKMRSYDFFIDGEDEERYTRFFYGNNSWKIGYVI